MSGCLRLSIPRRRGGENRNVWKSKVNAGFNYA